jgi:hypothetical protein
LIDDLKGVIAQRALDWTVLTTESADGVSAWGRF